MTVNSIADFSAVANDLNKQRFAAAQKHAETCDHTPPCLAPMFCLPVPDFCLQGYFDAGMTPEQALDAMDAEEARLNAAMCRAEAY